MKSTYIRCQGRKLFGFCPLWAWQVFHISTARSRAGLATSPNTRAISLSFVVSPSTKWVYHSHVQLNGSSGPSACILATASA